jgi:hypothetical protein
VLGISVRSNAKAVIAEINGLTYGGTRLATSRALNRAIGGVETDASREIRKTYRLKKATVDKSFSERRATPGALVAILVVSGRPLSLASFSPTQVKATRRSGGGVFVNIKGTRKLVPGAFIQTLSTKKGDEYQVVFKRVGKARYPIKALKTVDIPGVFSKDEIQAVIDAAAEERFETELHRQIAYLLRLQNG